MNNYVDTRNRAYEDSLRLMGYHRALAVLVRKNEPSPRRSQLVGFVAYRKRDNHKELIVVCDGYLHRTRYYLPQTKAGTIPAIAQAYGLDMTYTITLKDMRAQREHTRRINEREIRSSAPKMGKARGSSIKYGNPDNMQVIF